ncbi:CPBP family intramembrane metalloprotease [Clostridium sp. 'deep sea']|uniref:CPBP family intramembrane glutamic endopeptidase n=1 Tax=Clostridium sp. 'deep sea' TaxID=2779445 RepID=UPI0018968F88|nr:CPBP family intramembrane glutamic endopeptidase [Clostridium sp. 'deep sea']QOR35056.1 CPBP family intramembrane metalloprotease [Clostridium sp. 'deep sea']
MTIVVNSLVQALINLVIFSAVPFIWWLIFYRETTNFFSFVGLHKIKIKNTQKYALVFIALILFSLIFVMLVKYSPSLNQNSATTNIEGTGVIYIIAALLFSFVKTALAEEILFRGFIAKRMISRFGFKLGNIIQCFIFGVLHGILFYKLVGLITAILITLLISVSAWFSGWINEKQSGGSIISSWLLHGISNFIASLVALI